MPIRDPDSRPATDWSLVAALTVYFAAVTAMWWAIHARTGGIGYTVDDAYIHGTIARNLATSGTFGIIPGEFAAASSSLLWTFLMSLVFLVTGPQTWIPAVMATLFGALTIERANFLLKSTGTAPLARGVVVIMALAYAPVLPIVSTGMEHTMHAWTILGLFAAIAGRPRPGTVFLWALLAAGARYESLFALPPLLIWLALQRRWRVAAELGCGMAVPVLAFAAYSLAHGGFALPNSLMLKGHIAGAFRFRALDLMLEKPYLLILTVLLVIATLILAMTGKKQGTKLTWLPAAALVMLVIHLQLAKLGWFWRYEGYLVILGILATAPAVTALRGWLRRLPPALAVVVYALMVIDTFPLFDRCLRAQGQIVQAVGNIHDQQLQMARVIHHLGKDARVAVNDLGAVTFLSDARVLDLWGLGDNRIAREKHDRGNGNVAGYVSSRVVEDRIDYVVAYPSWFKPPVSLPATLLPVEMWKLGDNLICASDTVMFYGASPQAAAKLATALDLYRAELRPDPQSTNRMFPIPFK